MAKILYFEVNAVSILILLVLLWEIHRKKADRFLDDQKIFEKMLLINLSSLLLDTIITLLDGRTAIWALVLNRCACVGFYAVDPWMGLLYLIYCDSKLKVAQNIRECHNKICLALALGNLLLVVASLFRPVLFWLDAGNHYRRGPWFLACLAISYLVMLWGIMEVIAYRRREGKRSDRLYETLLLLPIPPFLGSILQVLIPGTSVVWVSTMLSLLIVFINIQNAQITTDTLTGLFNRGQLQPYVRWKSQHRKTGQELYLVMLDIDHFKQINDRFGHPVGDRALTQASGCIRSVCRPDDFLARYGGDEFVAVLERAEESEVRLLLEELQSKARSVREMYTLSLSTGYSRWQDCGGNLQEFLMEADRQMYRIKKDKRSEKEGVFRA